MRKIFFISIGILLLAVSLFTYSYFVKNKKKPKTNIEKIVKTVYSKPVKNTTIPFVITSNGTVFSSRKIALFSEVQGILKLHTKAFKEGTNYKKHETIIRINSDEFISNFKSQQSNFYNKLIAIMPDIKLDFPNEFEKWNQYISSYKIGQKLRPLPTTTSDKEKFFISGRGIDASYYALKNLEVKLAKFTLKAPFNGILTEALVSNGSLVRPGQKLGEFINLDRYELEIAVGTENAHFLTIGKPVSLNNLEKTVNYTGKIIRINGKIDAATQTLKVYVQISDKRLKEGMYLEATIQASEVENAVEIPRKLLQNTNQLYVVKNNKLELVTVFPVFYGENTVIVKGLTDGSNILTKSLPGAYPGMSVRLSSETP